MIVLIDTKRPTPFVPLPGGGEESEENPPPLSPSLEEVKKAKSPTPFVPLPGGGEESEEPHPLCEADPKAKIGF